MIECIQTIK